MNNRIEQRTNYDFAALLGCRIMASYVRGVCVTWVQFSTS